MNHPFLSFVFQAPSQLDLLLQDKGCAQARLDVLNNQHVLLADDFYSVSVANSPVKCFDVVSAHENNHCVGIVVSQDYPLTPDQTELMSCWIGFCARLHPQLNITSSWVDRVHATGTERMNISLSAPEKDVEFSKTLQSLAPPPPTLAQLVEQFAAWRLVSQEAENASKAVEEQIAQATDKTSFQSDDTIPSGVAKIKITKNYKPEKVDEVIVKMMTQLNFPPEEIQANYTKHPNFSIPSKVDPESLINLLQYHLKIDVRTDPRFKDAITQEAKPNMNTRVEFLKDLDVSGSVNWDELIDWDNSVIKTELVREAMSGPTRDLRQSIVSAIRGQIGPVVDQTGHYYAQERSKIMANENSQPRKKARSSKK